jgi:hypothetical protein
VAWRYDFYLLVLKTIFYSLAALVRKILVSPLEDKSHIFAPPCNILYIRTLKDITKYQWDIFCDVFTSEDVDADSTDQNECWFVFCDCVVLLTDTWFYIFVHGESNILLIHYTFVLKVLFALLEIRIHTLIRAALYPLHIIVSSVFQVPDTAMVEDSSNFRS